MNPVFPVYTVLNHTCDTNKPVFFTAILLFSVSFIHPDTNECKTHDSKIEEIHEVRSSKKWINEIKIYQPEK